MAILVEKTEKNIVSFVQDLTAGKLNGVEVVFTTESEYKQLAQSCKDFGANPVYEKGGKDKLLSVERFVKLGLKDEKYPEFTAIVSEGIAWREKMAKFLSENNVKAQSGIYIGNVDGVKKSKKSAK